MIVFNGETLLTIYEHGFEWIDRRNDDENECGGRDEALAISVNRPADSERYQLTLSNTEKLDAMAWAVNLLKHCYPR